MKTKTSSTRASNRAEVRPASEIIADWKGRRIPLRKTSDEHGRLPSKTSAAAVNSRAPNAKRRGPLATFQRILVPIDFSAESSRALKFAAALAKSNGSEATLVHVVGPVHDLRDFRYARQRLRTLGQRHFQTDTDVEFQPVVRNGNASEQILKEAEEMDADVIVISTRGLSRAPDSRIGNIAKRIVRLAPCPVLILPGKLEPAKRRDRKTTKTGR